MSTNLFTPARLTWTMVLLLMAIVFSLPLFWMISTSVKPEAQAASSQIRLLPDPPSTTLLQAQENYEAVWTDDTVRFPVFLRNTLIVAGLSVVGMTLSSAMVAYGLACIPWPGRNVLATIITSTMLIPFPVLVVPLFMIFKTLGWNGTLSPLWVPAWFGGAFNIFLLRQFFMQIPKDLLEAARVDGMGHWGIFWRVVVPLSKPALSVVAVFHFVYVWNDFLGPLIFLNDRDTFTLGLGLQLYQSQAGQTPWNLLMAASTMVILPIMLLFVLMQQTFTKSLSSDGLKG
jgi:multiple sugar transport system permease protein